MELNGALLVYMPVVCRHFYTESEGNHENSRDKEQAGVTYCSDVAAKPLSFLQTTSWCVVKLTYLLPYLLTYLLT